MIVPLVLAVAALQAAPPQDSLTITVRPAAIELAYGQSGRLTATVVNRAGNGVEGLTLRWVSLTPDVVTVTQDGRITAVAPGSATVLAVVPGARSGRADVTVPQLPPDSIAITLGGTLPAGTGTTLGVTVRTRLGTVLEDAPVRFRSSDEAVATVDPTGRVRAHRPGTAQITVSAGDRTASRPLRVTANTAGSYTINPAGHTARTGDVVRFRVTAMGPQGAVTGFMPVWAVSGAGAQIEAEGGEGVFVAEEPGTYRVTAVVGPAIVRDAVVTVQSRGYDAHLERVGRGPASEHHSGDTWVFEGVDGRDYAYIGTFQYDWMKVWDVTDPAHPVLTDSVQVDARRINDVKIHPNNRLAVITREGASNRRNGIVLLDLATPAHPRILSEYTDSVTGGVHNVWILGDENLIYACHNGTSDVHIIDISDPARPRQVGRWGLERQAKTLHDVIVQDGYAYLSYWDDGVVILDAGAGTHGGTARQPVFVSRYAYPAGNTHTAWRSGDYLFVGDEIFPPNWNADAPIETRGYVHVLDVRDLDHPREVARYEVPEAGAHNLWAEGDRLYVGYYQAGLRVVDISGELRGDLYAQGREVAAYKTTDAETTVPNWPMTWGAQIFKGNIFTSDLNSGLWIARLIETRPVP